jgi:hypothetical protein
LRSEVTREASATVVALSEEAGTLPGFAALVLEARALHPRAAAHTRAPRRATRATQCRDATPAAPQLRATRHATHPCVRSTHSTHRSRASRTPSLTPHQVLMPSLLKLVAVPHKVMADHGHLAASASFAAAASHRVAKSLAESQSERRAPVNLRVRCAEYLGRALAVWSEDVLAREPETFEAAIAAGVTDASPDVRAPRLRAAHRAWLRTHARCVGAWAHAQRCAHVLQLRRRCALNSRFLWREEASIH